MALIIAFAAFLSTLGGGLFALKFQSRLRLIMAFTAGVLVGLVAFDLLPEIFDHVQRGNVRIVIPMVALVFGFLVFHTLRSLLLHRRGVDKGSGTPEVGMLSALFLSLHSFIDGLGIGFGFQVSTALGVAIAIAVLAHDFSDGLNTVALVLVNKNSSRRAFLLLLLDAIAPILGATASYFLVLNPTITVVYLGFFAGFLLYIGASDLLPEVYREGSGAALPLLTISGVVFAFLVGWFT